MNDSLLKCVSCFLRYRSFPHDISPFTQKKRFAIEKSPVKISNEDDLDIFLKKFFKNIDFNKTGIMLSGGIDSSLLASYMPKGSYAFTISYPEMKNKDEVERAKFFAKSFGLKLIVVEVTFQDVLNFHDELAINKGQPLSSIEIGIYKMCLEAKKYNLTSLITGMGADGVFGGTFNLMSRDWTNNEFVERFTYIKPEIVMRNPVDSMEFYEMYYSDPYFDMFGFLDDVESEYTVSYFANPSQLSGIKLYAPFESCVRDFELDRNEMLNGNEKKLLRLLFRKRNGFEFSGIKKAFPRPTEYWENFYSDKLDSVFYKDSYSRLSNPEQKWILFTTNRFIELFKNGSFKK